MEEWRDVVGYEGLYLVSNTGRVRSKPRIITMRNGGEYYKEGTVLRHGYDSNGYPYVNLYKDAVPHHASVHRLVAMAFVSNPNNYTTVNHIDENKANNNADNLEWCTEKYNTNYGNGIKRKVEKRIRNNPLFVCHENGKIYKNQNKCARELNISQGSIFYALNGKRHHAGGYHFSYV